VNINYKQPQFELFPGSSANAEDPSRPRYLLANLTLSIENLVVLSILGIMVAVFAYSLGVERGKHLMAAQARPVSLVPAASDLQTVAVQQTVAPVVTTVARQTPAAVNQSNAVPAAVRPSAVTTTAVIAQKPAVPASAFKYTIQVASYADEKFAHKAAGELNKNGFETLVMQKGKYAILCVGKFAQKNEAMSVISKLKSKYKDCLVRSM
jgi:cell division septation protein DedD